MNISIICTTIGTGVNAFIYGYTNPNYRIVFKHYYKKLQRKRARRLSVRSIERRSSNISQKIIHESSYHGEQSTKFVDISRSVSQELVRSGSLGGNMILPMSEELKKSLIARRQSCYVWIFQKKMISKKWCQQKNRFSAGNWPVSSFSIYFLHTLLSINIWNAAIT